MGWRIVVLVCAAVVVFALMSAALSLVGCEVNGSGLGDAGDGSSGGGGAFTGGADAGAAAGAGGFSPCPVDVPDEINGSCGTVVIHCPGYVHSCRCADVEYDCLDSGLDDSGDAHD